MRDSIAQYGANVVRLASLVLLITSFQLAHANYPGLLRSDFSNSCLEATGAAATDGTSAEQSTCDGAAHQVLDFLPSNNQVNVYRLRATHANKCFQVANTSAGTDLTLTACSNINSQYFELLAQADGSYQLRSLHSNLLVGLASESNSNGVDIEQQNPTGSAAQKWRIANHDFSDPSVHGRWGDVIPWPHIAVSAANLPDGRILTFSGSERETWPSTERTYSATWNPETGEFVEQTHIGHNMFCAHLAMAVDGQVFVNGGRNQTNSPWTSLFQYLDNSWTQIDNMPTGGRWYPTTLSLADGDMFTAIGTASNQRNPDRWDARTGKWMNPPPTGIDFQSPVLDYGSTHGEHRWWPLLHLAPQGKIFHSGPTPTMGWINTAGSGQYEDTGIRQDAWYHKHGTSIMYDEGKILNAGGWVAGGNTTSSPQAFTVDLTGPSPVVALTNPMTHARKFHNGIMSPLGDVFVIGGNTSGAKFSDNGRILSAESWDPDTGTWTEHAEMTIPRNYHSIALLLTDGRILSAGSGYCSGNRYCSGSSHRDGQVYEPPYLFNADGSYATRPQIQSGPGFVEVGSVFNLSTDSAVAYFSMIKMGATTHGMNTDVRYLRPDMLEISATNYQLTANPNPNVLSPGYWMVFAVNADGVPSKAHVVRITTPDVDYDNVALTGSVSQSSTDGALVAGNAINGDMTSTATAVASTNVESGAWWELNLGSLSEIHAIRLWSHCCTDDLSDAYVLISDEPFSATDLATSRSQNGVTEHYIGSAVNGVLDITVNRTGRYIRVQKASAGAMSLAEVQVFGDPPGAGTSGLVHYEYFEGSFSSLPDFTSLSPLKTGFLDEFSLSPATATDGFAMRFYGQLEIASPGTYTFYADSSDGSRIVINGVEVVNNDGIHGASETLGALALDAGRHDILVEYFDNAAAESLTISYEGPGVIKQPIPSSALALLPEPAGTGEILREWWTGISGTAVSDLTSHPAYPDAPTGADVRSLFEAPINWADNYGTRMRGFLYPPFSGEYTFTISSDDGGELRLSTDEQPSNASVIATVPGWTSSRQWDKFPEQQSAPVFLERSKRYYIEAFMKEQGGGDNLAIAWQPPVGGFEVIDGAYLSEFTTPLSLGSVDTPPQESTGLVTLTANATGDALQYSWSFGDGSPDTPFGTAASIAHAYPGPGRYTGSVTIKDISGNTITEGFQQIVHAPLTAQRPNASSSIVYHMDRAEVWNVNPDNDTTTGIDANGHAVTTEVIVGDNPRGIAVAPDWQLWVTNKDDGTISVINPSTHAVSNTIDLGTGSQPHGIVANPSGTEMYVALEATGEVVKLDGIAQTESSRAFVGASVRHLSISADGSRLLASRFITPKVPGEEGASPDISSAGGIVEVLDADLNPVGTTLLQHSDRLVSEHSGPGLPNYLAAAAITPDGLEAWVPSKQDNVLRGHIRNGLPLVHDQTVRSVTSRIDMGTLTEMFAARVEHDNSSVPTSAAFDPTGSFMYVALEGNRQIAITDRYGWNEIYRFDTGRAPQGVTLSPSGTKLFVHNFMDRSVTIHDLSDVHNSGALNVPLLATIPTVSTESLTADVLKGKQFFYDSRDDRLAAEEYMSCASCHNEGLHDGRTWDFTQFGEGVRNTVTLEARGMGHGPVHWTANFDEIQDFESQIRSFALGTGLMSNTDFAAGTRSDALGDPKAGVSADLDALAAYVNSLTKVPASPYRQPNGELTAQGAAGRDLFVSFDCGSCHTGSELTDSDTLTLHNVGTIKAVSGNRMGIPLTDPGQGLDTPSLLALNGTEPFLHDGSATTIKAAIMAHTTLSVLDSEAEAMATFLAELNPVDLVTLPIAVPDLVGSAQTAAQTLVTEAGLSVGAISVQYSDTVAADVVMSQDPTAGEIVSPATAVNLVVSNGPVPPVPTPNVVGMTQANATIEITNAGLILGAITNSYSDTVPAGEVISQDPAAGVELAPGSAVALEISDGPEPLISVPDLSGLDQMSAESAVVTAGLAVGTIGGEYSASVPAGHVVSHDPVAGTEVSAGSNVDLILSNGPAPVLVPSVTGLTQAEAEASVITVGLIVGAITNTYSDTVPTGQVIGQNPAGGTEVAPGTSVALTVSDGPAPISTPNVVGLAQAAAEAAITGAGLITGSIITAYSESVPSGSVISQNPAAGAELAAGTPVDLVVSNGPAPVAVPGVTGLSQSAAEASILSAGLNVGPITTAYSDTAPSGQVITQNPTAGTEVAPGTAVTLTVSDGPAPIPAPSVVGLTEAAAQSAITGVGLTVGAITTAYSDTVPTGSVIAQNPTAGTQMTAGASINLVVSEGPTPIPVPAVTGLSQSAAQSAIGSAGLSLGSIITQYSAAVAAGDVISQSPSAGVEVAPGSAVALVVSDGPAPVIVPGVAGLTQAAAESTIVSSGLTVGVISNIYSNTVPLGSVISQSPLPGTEVSPGTAVALTVSDGPAPIPAPSVTGLSQAAAEAAISSAGLTTGSITTAYSDTVPAGNVISQNPVAGTELSAGASIDLVVSEGPAPIPVPAVTGLSQSAAQSAISSAGLSVGSIATQYSPTVAAGNVISQIPGAGAEVAPGSAVDLIVSTGPQPVPAPNVVGLTQATAESAITGAGFTVGTLTSAYSETVPSGNVISQNPTAGTSLLPGASISLVISDGPAPVTVPDVVGATQAAAESALGSAGLATGVVTTQFDISVPAGSVISQAPSAGTLVSSGSTVDLIVSDGPAPVAVPAVIGLSETDATADISAAGFTIGTKDVAFSESVPLDHVINQNPSAGSQALPGSVIDLTLSAGPQPSGPNLHRGVLNNVGSNWQTVSLPAAYADMVVIATPQYGKTALPVVTRVRNATGSSFDLKVQNPSGTSVSGYTVRYIVLEAGVYNEVDHGINMEAHKVSIVTTDEDASWAGETQVYRNLYTSPVVLGQVMTENDTRWSVFWASDGTTGNPPSPSSLSVGKHVAEDTDVNRAPETVGYVVVDSGTGQLDGVAYAAGVGADIVEGVTEAPAPYTYPIGLFADTAVLSSAGMDGTNGGWPVLHADLPLPAAQLGVGVDEDLIGDSERIRTTDQLAFFAFGEIVEGSSPQLASGVATNVGDAWQTITLPHTYADMVVVATPEYAASDLPVVTRIRNASGNQFEVRVQNPSGASVSGYTVRYVAVEAGVYTGANNGIQMEAVKFTSTVTDENNSWAGEQRSYANAYASPVVLGQVMTANDADWSVFWASNGSRSTPPSSTSLEVGKHVGEDTDVTRAAEEIGYIVLEAGTISIDGVTIKAGVTADNIKGPDDSGQPYTNGISFTADNIVVSAAAMDGNNGGWPVLDSQVSMPSNAPAMLFDEDQVGDSERKHTTEQAAYLAIDE